jgi:hypothetical protein
MEPEGSLPHSQLPTTCPYPEPAQSSPCPHIQLPEYKSQYVSVHHILNVNFLHKLISSVHLSIWKTVSFKPKYKFANIWFNPCLEYEFISMYFELVVWYFCSSAS